ncbi:MAG: RNA polymerase sigma factor [Fimbriimonadaceae bacterium]|nr:RNA polymerase sigma factor [Fimbriimonadaceae bacterium]
MHNAKFSTWEQHLVQRACQGERIAFELLTDLYRPALFSLSLKMLRNADDAKDAVQEALLKAYKAITSFDPERPIKPWLFRICQNCCVDSVRSRRKGGDSLDDHEYMLQDQGESIEERAEGNLSNRAVVAAIGRLPERYRQIIHMRHFRHMEVNEIARELRKPEGTIKSWLFRARALLKKDLGLVTG